MVVILPLFAKTNSVREIPMPAILADARRGHPGLFWFAVASAVLTVVLAGLAAVDPRMLLGSGVWVKPMKFAISFTAYAGALAWMLGRLPRPALQRTGWVLVVASVVEQVIITVQAGRGARSHFNADDGGGILLYSVMGATVVVIYLATISVALRFLREPGGGGVMASAVRAGLGVTVVGLSVGILMVAFSAHTVGAPDGGPGLPLVGWSTVAGDLRIAHFVGLHGLQVLPLVAAALAAGRRFDVTGGRQVVRAVGAGYTALILLLTWQALRGQPLLAPDAPTLAALAAIVVGTGVAVTGAARASARRRAVPQHLTTTV
jgi:hypothetical protein